MHKSTARPAAFTLIEVMLAMAIMTVICGTIYQFTGTTARVANVATFVDARSQALGGLRRLLAAQLSALPMSEPAALVGAPKDGDHGRRDILQMLCPSGGPMLTPDARGLYQVALELRELPGGKGHRSLVMDRQPWQDEETGPATGGFQLPAVSAGGVRTRGNGGSLGVRPEGWVRLLEGVRSLEFDYFDPRLNTWVDKWNDPTMAPSLVRVRLGMDEGGAPYEFVEKVPGGGVPRLPANLAAAALTLPNGFPAGAGGAFNGSPAGALPGGTVGTSAGTIPKGVSAPTAPPPGAPPSLPAGLRPPTSAPPMFDPTKPFMAPDTGTGLPPGFQR